MGKCPTHQACYSFGSKAQALVAGHDCITNLIHSSLVRLPLEATNSDSSSLFVCFADEQEVPGSPACSVWIFFEVIQRIRLCIVIVKWRRPILRNVSIEQMGKIRRAVQ